MNGMKHSKTMGMKRDVTKTTKPTGRGKARMDTSHRTYAKDRRQGGPFGK